MSYGQQFDDALQFASELHRDQTRKGKDVPYVTHLLGVASIVGAHGGDETQVAAALLHDAIEDCIAAVPDLRERIRSRFGEDVLRIVEACTDAETHPKPSWPSRKRRYLETLLSRSDDDPSLLVSNADKLHNARSILRDLQEERYGIWRRFKGGHAGTLWYYRSLADIFQHKTVGHPAAELERVVDEIVEVGGVPDIVEQMTRRLGAVALDVGRVSRESISIRSSRDGYLLVGEEIDQPIGFLDGDVYTLHVFVESASQEEYSAEGLPEALAPNPSELFERAGELADADGVPETGAGEEPGSTRYREFGRPFDRLEEVVGVCTALQSGGKTRDDLSAEDGWWWRGPEVSI